MTIKDEVIEFIQRMPDDARIDDILYALYVRSKVDRGLEQLDRGEGISHEEVMRQVSEWLT